MNKSKLLIRWLHLLFKGVWFINLVLAGGAIGFQIMNIIHPIKMIAASYLGKFKVGLNFPGHFQGYHGVIETVFFQELTGSPDIILKSNYQSLFVLIFSLLIISVVLFYNYQLWKLFEGLNQSVSGGTPFQTDIVTRLRRTAVVSILLFVGGSVISLLKFYFLREVSLGGVLNFQPVYDNQLLNFMWIGIFLYILSHIFQAGLVLQEEHDLTI